MSSTKTRIGAPVEPVITTAGTPGTSDQVRTFQSAGGQTQYVRPCVVTNMHTTDDVYILINEESATATNYLRKVPAGETVDFSFHGRVNVGLVSLYFVTAAYSNVQIRGWTP